MPRAIRPLALAVLAALAVPVHAQQDDGALFSVFGDPRVDAPVVSVRLSEDVTAPADIARFSVTVSTDENNPEAALRANSMAAAAVIAALKAQGLTDADFKPGAVSVTQRRGGRNSSVRGYTASNRINVETADVGRVSLMIAEAIAKGATDADGPHFDRKDMEPLISPLREHLFRKAETQAKDYARAGGYTRVRPVAISERLDSHSAVPAYFAVMEIAESSSGSAAEAMAPPVPSTDVVNTLNLSITFRLER